MSSPAEIRLAYDRQVRRDLRPVQPGWRTEDAGTVVRVTAPPTSEASFVSWSDLDAHTADAAIAAQVAHFARLGQPFEWKLYGHDRPTDLAGRLLSAGFTPGAEEAFVVGETSAVLAATEGCEGTDGVEIREADDDDFPAMAELTRRVWGHDSTRQLAELRGERDSDPAALRIHVAVAAGQVVSAGWVRLPPGQDFASLWGGATHPQWRRRGIYRALVRQRASHAAASHRFLQVDASPSSRPILERLGLQVLDWTRPYLWRPPQRSPVTR